MPRNFGGIQTKERKRMDMNNANERFKAKLKRKNGET